MAPGKILQLTRRTLIRRNVTHLVGVVRNRKNGRGGEIRTRDLYVPNVALYQAKLRPDNICLGRGARWRTEGN